MLNWTKPKIFILAGVLTASSFANAQNSKGQRESDQYWSDYSKGFEWFSTSKNIPAAIAPSPVDLSSEGSDIAIANEIDEVFDPDIHRIVIVSRGRNILYRKYNQKWVNELSRPSSSSMAKSLVAITTGRAMCDGKIHSLDDLANKYVPALDGTSWGNAKIKHLLSMSSGSHKPEPATTGSPTQEVNTETLVKSYAGTVNADFIDLMRRSDGKYSSSGKQANYNNLDTIALSMVVEAATGQRFHEYFAKAVWQPLGAEQPAKWAASRSGQVLAFSGFTAYPLDWIRLANNLIDEMSSSTCLGDYLKQASSQQSAVPVGTGVVPYGYQMYPNCGGPGSLCFAGYGGQRLFISPKTGMVLYLHGSSELGARRFNRLFATWVKKAL